MRILFILGSGASVDAGLFTYRGHNSVPSTIAYTTDSTPIVEEKLRGLQDRLRSVPDGLSPTYALVQAIVDRCPGSVILTQNIDGLVRRIQNAEYIELHGNVNETVCPVCGALNAGVHCQQSPRPNVVLIGDTLPEYPRTKRIVKRSYDYVLIIGTTLEFPYLRRLIGVPKGYGARIVHVNPDPDYARIVSTGPSLGKRLKNRQSNIRPGELFVNETAENGLRQFLNGLDGRIISSTD
jgi:NAD-dependent SIR2 family protein deacetylase